METIEIVNLKCGGCAKTITSALEAQNIKNIHVDVASSSVSFEGDVILARKVLTAKGYPPVNSPEAGSMLKKAQSYASCMVGKFK